MLLPTVYKTMRSFSTLLGAAAVLAFCSSAQAVAIHIAYTPSIPTQATTNGDAALATWASESIATYNASNNPDLPALPTTGFKVEQGGAGPAGFTFGSDVESITLGLSANSYLILSFGGSNLNVGNGNAENLYFITSTGFYDFTNEPNASGGLSSIHFFGNPGDLPTPGTGPRVPDGGLTIAMLGFGLIGMCVLRRTLKA
jgi:hypothetical protein